MSHASGSSLNCSLKLVCVVDFVWVYPRETARGGIHGDLPGSKQLGRLFAKFAESSISNYRYRAIRLR